MPKYMKVSDVRETTYAELERWWEVDFDVLVTSAVAEATGPVHSSVREALASEDWIEQWADALYAGTGELLSSVERMTYLRDSRLKVTRKRYGQMMQRMQHVNSQLNARVTRQGWDLAPETNKDSRAASLSILARHHHDEFVKLRDQICAERGLPRDDPMYRVSYADSFDAIEDGLARGFVYAPVTQAVRLLHASPLERIKAQVADDVTKQAERCDALRHPLMLRKWSLSLKALLDEHCQLSGLNPSFTITLPSLDMKELWRMTEGEARRLLNRRRFLRALAQRNRECEMHRRQMVRAVNMRTGEVKQPWLDAAQTARERVALRYPDEYMALLAAFTPFCEPGSTRIRKGALGRRGHSELVSELKRGLAEGTLPSR
jgi:hypothetical protein